MRAETKSMDDGEERRIWSLTDPDILQAVLTKDEGKIRWCRRRRMDVGHNDQK